LKVVLDYILYLYIYITIETQRGCIAWKLHFTCICVGCHWCCVKNQSPWGYHTMWDHTGWPTGVGRFKKRSTR